MIEIISYKQAESGCRKGFIRFYVPKWDWEFNDVALFEKNGKQWIAFMNKEYESGGEKKYYPCGRFRDQGNQVKLQQEVIEALKTWMMDEFKRNHSDNPDKNLIKQGQGPAVKQQINEVPF